MIEYYPRIHKRLGHFLLILGLLLVHCGQTNAEIYTYEKDGVIVISSEPPPRPKRKRIRRKKLKAHFKGLRHNLSNDKARFEVRNESKDQSKPKRCICFLSRFAFSK